MAGARRRRRMKRDAKHGRGRGRQHRRTVAHRHHAIHAQAAQRLERFLDLIELHRDGVVAPGVVEDVAAVGGQRDVDAQPPRRVGKNADLVPGSRGKKEQMLRQLITPFTPELPLPAPGSRDPQSATGAPESVPVPRPGSAPDCATPLPAPFPSATPVPDGSMADRTGPRPPARGIQQKPRQALRDAAKRHRLHYSHQMPQSPSHHRQQLQRHAGKLPADLMRSSY